MTLSKRMLRARLTYLKPVKPGWTALYACSCGREIIENVRAVNAGRVKCCEECKAQMDTK